MRCLYVSIEKNGYQIPVGTIRGEHSEDAVFQYDEVFMSSEDARPISISLPFREEAFSVSQTRNFFEGLLPEGFTRRTVAGWLHLDEADYLSILAELGAECLGAVRITEKEDEPFAGGYTKLEMEEVQRLAGEGASKSAEFVIKAHLSLTGASGKVGLLQKGEDWYLPYGNAPGTHIVKQSHVRLNHIVVNEQLCMRTAFFLGIPVPESAIIDTGTGKDEEILLASKRYDRSLNGSVRVLNGIACPLRLHQEDFSQALGIPPYRKYEKPEEHYLKRMMDLLRKYSSDPISDQMKLWDISVFNYLIGNTDGHIKNYSICYDADLKGKRLAPAYDLLSTAVYESSTEEMAYSINGKYALQEIRREDFAAEAKRCGIGGTMAMNHFDRLYDALPDALEEAAESLQPNFGIAGEIKHKILASGGYGNVR